MNAKIEQRHRQRLADLMNADAYDKSGWFKAEHFGGTITSFERIALQLIANADAAARGFRSIDGLPYDPAAIDALICPDDTETAKETEK
jgi:hypothetical protein